MKKPNNISPTLKSKTVANYWKKKYEKLQEEFDQYKQEAIKWSVKDFTTLEIEGYSITEEQAQEALEHMIRKHDCTLGITWDTLDCYVQEYGTKVKKGEELWRKYQEKD